MMKTEESVIVFEDENLAKLLAEEICGEPNLGVLTKSNLANITELFSVTMLIPRQEKDKIKSLRGLENCINLTQLHLIDHLITDLGPLYDMEHLKIVVLRKNLIKSIDPLSCKDSIETLVVGQNNINDITPVESMKGLKELFVQENPLSNKSLLFVNELPHLKKFCFWETKDEYSEEANNFKSSIELMHDKLAV